MKKKIFIIVCLLLFSSVVSGCSMLNRSYLVITPHLEQRTENPISESLRADTYSGLKNAIIMLISESADMGTIRLYNYSGNVEDDVRTACRDIIMETPIGVYAVEYMSSKYVRILTYYEVTVSISYRRTPEQIASIIQIANAMEYQNALLDVYADYGNTLTSEIQYFYSEQYDVQSMLDNRYYNEPVECLSMPTFEMTQYPDSPVWHRIIEVTLDYHIDPDTLKKMTEELYARIDELTSELPADSSAPLDTLLSLYELAAGNIEYLPDLEDDLANDIKKDSTFTAYGALVEGNATSEGYALAFKALCDLSGIDCTVVRGRYNGLSHCWNIVQIQNSWYHIDVSLGDIGGTYDFLLKTDPQINETHKWNAAMYPPCAGEELDVFQPDSR
jgi:hypothetical protein